MAKKTKKKKKTSSPRRRTLRKRIPARRARRVVRKIPKRKAPPKRRLPKRRPPKRRPPTSVEYQVNVSYRNRQRPGGALTLQFSVIGPPNRTKDQIIDAILYTIESEGEDVPKGYRVRIVSWKGGTVPRDVPWGSLAIVAGEPATRFDVQ